MIVSVFSFVLGFSQVGIGIVDPLETLHVNGGARISSGLSLGNTTFGPYKLVAVDPVSPSIMIGNTAFNNVESGRITFNEHGGSINTDVDSYCGFQIVHDGNFNRLLITPACPTPLTDPLLSLFRSNQIGVSTDNPTSLFSVNGIAGKPGGGSWAVYSDKRLKKNISPYNEGLSLIMKVKPISFSYNNTFAETFGVGDGTSTTKEFQGVIAQELQLIAPYMVRVINTDVNDTADADGGSPVLSSKDYLEIDPSKFTYALINSVQQQQQEQIEVLQKEIKALKGQVKQLLAKE